jgi:uncharacterized repeat protein (TIGR02543 family)
MALMVILTALVCAACSTSGGGDSDDVYAVAYDKNGATSGTVPYDGNEYAHGDTVTVMGNTGSLAKTGYKYTGWNTMADGTGETYTEDQEFPMGRSQVRFYAKWTANSVATYTVSYNANGATGGNVPVNTTNYEVGQSVTVQGNSGSLVKTDYDFAGWNTAADGSGTSYAAGASFAMGNANVTLYARWTTNITFINTDADLNAVRGNLSGKYKLMADIDLSINYSAGWTPIGTDAAPFTGTFDGNNHTVSNLTISSAGDYQGLFGYASGATIRDLNLTGASVAGGNYVGALAGYSASSTITSCSAAGTSISGTDNVGGLLGYSSGTVAGTSGSSCHTGFTAVTGTENVGGFIGNNNGAVTYCYATGTVTGNYNVGGLIGANSGPVTYSHASPTATVTGTLYTGGLVGVSSPGGPISYCYASNQVVGSGSTFDIGGLVGRNWDAITNCYATGNVSGSFNVGGLVGLLRDPGTVGYCYAAGTASSGCGLIGQLDGTWNNSFFNNANASNSYGTATSLANMQIQATYGGWDFATVWAIDISGVINGGYPYLRNIAP